LGIRRGDVVSIIGGGGKTSLMFRLAREARSMGCNKLLQLTADKGGSRIMRSHHERVFTVPFACGDEFFDIDTKHEYQEILRKWQQKS